jgi:hypothetical protein
MGDSSIILEGGLTMEQVWSLVEQACNGIISPEDRKELAEFLARASSDKQGIILEIIRSDGGGD